MIGPMRRNSRRCMAATRGSHPAPWPPTIPATLALAQRVNNGHIVHEGPAEEIKAQPQILQRYLGL